LGYWISGLALGDLVFTFDFFDELLGLLRKQTERLFGRFIEVV
jgi:hypothetical protein